tara:strand:+ start:5632 stop:6396 length:765 start_codon:yes stop_codon:yes gene_type:complete
VCNAWNHPPNCTCGWGGEGHSGRNPSATSFNYGNIPPITATFHSYTIPNANCPVCGQRVFFYSCPNGGRAYFDELGPPWPRHPCTSQQRLLQPKPAKPTRKQRKKYRWQLEGWEPFFIRAAGRVDSTLIKVTGEFSGEPMSVYIAQPLIRGQARSGLSPDSICYIRKATEGAFELSAIIGVGKYTALGFLSAMEAGESIRNKGKKARKPRPVKKSHIKSKPSSQKSEKSRSRKQRNKKSVMAIAFDRARSKSEE